MWIPRNAKRHVLKNFASNPIMVQAGVMGEAYGEAPDKMLNADLTPAERFWFNNDVWAATRKFERMMRESSKGSSESSQMAAEQEQRAAQRDEPAAPEDQMEALERIEEIRQMGDH